MLWLEDSGDLMDTWTRCAVLRAQASSGLHLSDRTLICA